MKVKCVCLLDHEGNVISSSPWLNIGATYHVLSIFIDGKGGRRFWLNYQNQNEWPSIVEHRAECFEIVSTVVPSNWRLWIHESSAMGVSPFSWQSAEFTEALLEHEAKAYSIFEYERGIILNEDP